jgi:hypothetical protein
VEETAVVYSNPSATLAYAEFREPSEQKEVLALTISVCSTPHTAGIGVQGLQHRGQAGFHRCMLQENGNALYQ